MTSTGVHPKHRFNTKQSRAFRELPRITVGSIIIDGILTVSVIVLLFVAYTFFWSGVRTERVQDDARTKLIEQWNTSNTPPNTSGDANNPTQTVVTNSEGTVSGTQGIPTAGMAIMTAPRLGADWAYVVFPGVDPNTLSMGPGWYTETQQFGQTGNAAIAGHRDGAGAPFHDVNTFTTCDAITIETQHTIYTYRVLPTGDAPLTDMAACAPDDIVNALASEPYVNLTGSHIVDPTQGEVVFPVPMNSASQPTLSLLTITTCHPIWSNAQRLITHAVLTTTTEK